MTHTNLKITAVILTVGAIALFVPSPVQAGGWGVSVTPGGVGFSYGGRHGHVYVGPGPVYYNAPYYAPYYGPYYPRSYGPYYPSWNPVERRDVFEDGYMAPDGTVHEETTVEDRHSSYYSPGRNEAITPPRTTVRRDYGPGYAESQERTSWIGADGRPHSTTITRTTTEDPWGNTQTDTHVSLKNKKDPGTTQGETAVESAPQKLPEKKPLIKPNSVPQTGNE